jgi:hypothetical protein
MLKLSSLVVRRYLSPRLRIVFPSMHGQNEGGGAQTSLTTRGNLLYCHGYCDQDLSCQRPQIVLHFRVFCQCQWGSIRYLSCPIVPLSAIRIGGKLLVFYIYGCMTRPFSFILSRTSSVHIRQGFDRLFTLIRFEAGKRKQKLTARLVSKPFFVRDLMPCPGLYQRQEAPLLTKKSVRIKCCFGHSACGQMCH